VLATALQAPLALPAAAQFPQYTAPGTLADIRASTRENIEGEIEDARWETGPFRISPWLGLKNASYTGNVFASGPEDEVSDVTATAGAGVRVYVPFGTKVFWAAHALPEYVWWADLEERRRLNGRYGTGLFVYANRLTLELEARRADEQQIVTPEVEQLINARRDILSGALEIRVVGSLHLFAAAGDVEFRNLLDEESGGLVPPYELLDRDEQVTRAGVRFKVRERFSIGVAAEESDVDFVADPARSYTGDGVALELAYQANRFEVLADVADRELEPLPGGAFVPVDDTFGRVQLIFGPQSRMPISAYGQRTLVYTLSEDYSSFSDDLLGIAVTPKLGRRFAWRLYFESGENEYVPISPLIPPRQDDVVSYGTDLSLSLSKWALLVLGARSTDYDSTLEEFDRELTSVGLSLEVGIGEFSWP
jgi:hypothetical protein